MRCGKNILNGIIQTRHLFIGSLLVSTLIGCKAYNTDNEFDNRLHVLNYSPQTIYAIYSLNYPDTSLTFNNQDNNTPIKQGNYEYYSRCVQLTKNGNWEAFFKSKSKDFKLQIFVFDADDIENIKWSEIQKKNLVLKRFEFSYSELKKQKWDIIFGKENTFNY